MECSPVLEVTGRCDSLSHPVLHDCQAVLSAHPCQLHPLVAAVAGLLSMSELLWTLTPFIHDHLGMRQLKASGNLGFIDISQRPSQAPSAFLSRSATAPPTPACLPGRCPCTQPVGLNGCTCVGKTHFFLRKQQPLHGGGGGSGRWGEGLHPGVRSRKEGPIRSLFLVFSDVSFWEEHREGRKQHRGAK